MSLILTSTLEESQPSFSGKVSIYILMHQLIAGVSVITDNLYVNHESTFYRVQC